MFSPRLRRAPAFTEQAFLNVCPGPSHRPSVAGDDINDAAILLIVLWRDGVGHSGLISWQPRDAREFATSRQDMNAPGGPLVEYVRVLIRANEEEQLRCNRLDRSRSSILPGVLCRIDRSRQRGPKPNVGSDPPIPGSLVKGLDGSVKGAYESGVSYEN